MAAQNPAKFSLIKKILTICFAGALALAAAGCSDKKEGEKNTPGTITVSGITEKVGSAFYAYEPAERLREGTWTVVLCREKYVSAPTSEPDFYIAVRVSDSCLGKEIPLTETLAAGGALAPAVTVGLPNRLVDIDDEFIDISNSDGFLEGVTVTAGKLKLTRDGSKFTANLFVEFSDGVSASTNWSGEATQGEIE